MNKILESLGIQKDNYGACIGALEWFNTKDAGQLNSINPTNGNVLGNVFQCSEDDFENIISTVDNCQAGTIRYFY